MKFARLEPRKLEGKCQLSNQNAERAEREEREGERGRKRERREREGVSNPRFSGPFARN